MADRRDANRLSPVGYLVDDPVGADAERPQPLKSTVKGVARMRIALKQPKRVLDRVDQRPIELEQFTSGAPRQDDAGHLSAARAALGQLAAEILEGDGLLPRELRQAGFERSERIAIGENFGSLLQRLVFVDRH